MSIMYMLSKGFYEHYSYGIWDLVYLSLFLSRRRRIQRLESESSNDTQCDGANANAVSHSATS
jgi:hypothetical protein